MFKKTLGFVAVAAALTGLGLASTTTANADDTTTSDPQTTNASVSLEAGSGTSGAVTLVSAPSIVFTAANALNGSATSASGQVSGDLVVKNAGGSEGWNVTLSASPMKDAATGVALNGGSYTMNFNPTAVTTGSDTNESAVPTATNTKISTGETKNADGSVVTPATTSVMSADKGAGVGTWEGKVNTTELTIPSSAVAGDYNSILTWALSNAPA